MRLFVGQRTSESNTGELASFHIIIFCYLAYITFIWTNDLICFVFHYSGSLITYGIAALVVGSAIVYLRKKIALEHLLITGIDIAIILLILFAATIRIAIPDTSFDTLNYHIYLQERPFSDNVTYNFFPGRWINSFTIPLADRLFFPFRYFFGYRLGVIFNSIVIIIIFLQCKALFYELLPKSSEKNISLYSAICILTEQIFTLQCTYYVDIVAIPILLEILIWGLKKEYSRKKCIYLCFMTGIVITIKISTAFFIISIALAYLIKNYKKVKLLDIILGIIVVVLPLSPYLLNTYLQTGNPVYPFYNEVFRSKYLDCINWIDAGFGPNSLKELLFWPVIAFIEPRRAYDIDLYTGRIAICYIAANIYIVAKIIKYLANKMKKRDVKWTEQPLLLHAAVYVVSNLVWGQFMMGMIRYALILEVWGGAILISIIVGVLNSGCITKELFGTLLSALLAFQCTESTHVMLLTSKEPGWRNTAITDYSYWSTNLSALFQKKDYNEILDGVDCIGIVNYNSGQAALLSKEIPIVSLNAGYANQNGKEKFKHVLSHYQNIYVLSAESTLQSTLQQLAELGICQAGESRFFEADFISNTDRMCLIQVDIQSLLV